jgi:succinate dehydrogenase/fumarate reductase flavoprotein subunit
MTIQAGDDLTAFMSVTRSPRASVHMARRFSRHLMDLALRGRGMQLRDGNALVARLLRCAADLGVDLRTSSPAIRLLKDGDAARGAVLKTLTGEVEVQARRGVVLATGSFPRRQSLFPANEERLTLAAPSATGDGLRLGKHHRKIL